MSMRSTKAIKSPPVQPNNIRAEITTTKVRLSEVLFYPLRITGNIAIYQIGRLPKTFSSCAKYFMVRYVHDTNGILSK